MHRRSVEVYLYTFFNLGAGWGHVVDVTPPPLYPRYSLHRILGWPQGPVWTGAEKLALTGIRSPGRTTRSEWLYRLSNPDHQSCYNSQLLHSKLLELESFSSS